MASFYAELQVAGNVYRVVHCRYACHQATDARGRVQAKVRYAPLELVLDVPTDDGLLAWAHAPHKPLAGQVVFYDVARQTAHETIAFAAGECVQYAEDFASSATGDGAYVCQLTITAPSFELRAGGPATPLAIATALRQLSQGTVASAPATSLAPAPASEAWLDDLETVVGPAGTVRTLVATWVAGGLSEARLKAAVRQTVDKRLLFERLQNAKRGLYQQRVVIDDYAAIPGVSKQTYVPNGLPSVAIPASDFGVDDPGFDLPAWNAPTFTGSARLVEILPGEKLYRVTNDPVSEPFAKTGGYWTRTPPADLSEVISGTAVMPEWNNFQRVYEFTAPPYADPVAREPKFYAWEGPAAAQAVSGDYKEKLDNGHCLAGGAGQVFVPNKLARDKAYGFGQHITDVTALHKSW
jgi:hypothetical protein